MCVGHVVVGHVVVGHVGVSHVVVGHVCVALELSVSKVCSPFVCIGPCM